MRAEWFDKIQRRKRAYGSLSKITGSTILRDTLNAPPVHTLSQGITIDYIISLCCRPRWDPIATIRIEAKFPNWPNYSQKTDSFTMCGRTTGGQSEFHIWFIQIARSPAQNRKYSHQSWIDELCSGKRAQQWTWNSNSRHMRNQFDAALDTGNRNHEQFQGCLIARSQTAERKKHYSSNNLSSGGEK